MHAYRYTNWSLSKVSLCNHAVETIINALKHGYILVTYLNSVFVHFRNNHRAASRQISGHEILTPVKNHSWNAGQSSRSSKIYDTRHYQSRVKLENVASWA